MFIHSCSPQSQDKMTNDGVANDGVASGSDRRGPGSSTAAAGEVVGNDSMVVGKGIMIKGDVDNCAVSYTWFQDLVPVNRFSFNCLLIP